jgi:hypothetical protein
MTAGYNINQLKVLVKRRLFGIRIYFLRSEKNADRL